MITSNSEMLIISYSYLFNSNKCINIYQDHYNDANPQGARCIISLNFDSTSPLSDSPIYDAYIIQPIILNTI